MVSQPDGCEILLAMFVGGGGGGGGGCLVGWLVVVGVFCFFGFFFTAQDRQMVGQPEGQICIKKEPQVV